MRGLLEKAVRESQNNTGLTLNICLNYGGRAEIIDAIKKIIKDGKKPKDITEKLVGSYIYGGLDTPDPELIIRTSGEKRLSGFLTWRSVYSELFFLPKAWPDFKPADLKAVIKSFQQRERRFGK
jgi:undecaprenyl diphosphate synthase